MKYSNFDEEMTSYHHKTNMAEKRLMLHIKWVIGKSNKDKIKMKTRFNARQDVSFALFPSCIFFVIFVVLVVPGNETIYQTIFTGKLFPKSFYPSKQINIINRTLYWI